MTRTRRYVDHLEAAVGNALESKGIEFTHESEEAIGADFFLPHQNLFIEVKQFYSDRIVKQIMDKDNVIVLQGKRAVDFFVNTIKQMP